MNSPLSLRAKNINHISHLITSTTAFIGTQIAYCHTEILRRPFTQFLVNRISSNNDPNWYLSIFSVVFHSLHKAYLYLYSYITCIHYLRTLAHRYYTFLKFERIISIQISRRHFLDTGMRPLRRAFLVSHPPVDSTSSSFVFCPLSCTQ